MSKLNEKKAIEYTRIKVDQLSYLVKNYFKINVSIDKNYQRRFISCFKFRRSREFLKIIFDYLEYIKTNNANYEDVLRYIYNKTNRFEDKIATYIECLLFNKIIFFDKIRCDNIDGVNFDYSNLTDEERIKRTCNNYELIMERCDKIYNDSKYRLFDLFEKYAYDFDLVYFASNMLYLKYNKRYYNIESKKYFKPFNKYNRLIRELNIKNTKVIAIEAYAGCKNLKKVTMDNNIRKISVKAFKDCENLEYIHLSKRLYSISAYAFNNCIKLKNIELPYSLNRIFTGAFENCISLEYIKLSKNINHISNKVFDNCTALKVIEYEGIIEKFKEVTRYDFTNNDSIIIKCSDGEISSKDIIRMGEDKYD